MTRRLFCHSRRSQSLAIAAMITGETVAALRILGEGPGDINAGAIGLDDLSKVIQQGRPDHRRQRASLRAPIRSEAAAEPQR